MSNVAKLRQNFKRAIVKGDDERASQIRRFYMRELLRDGADLQAATIQVGNDRLDAIEARDTSLVGNFLKGTGSGAVGLYESAGLGLAALEEEEEELKTRAWIKENIGGLAPEGGNPDALAYKVGSGIGSILGLVPAALSAPIAAKAGVGALGAKAIGLGLGAGISAGAGAGEASERARAGNATQEERNKAAFLGSLVGTTEILPLGRAIKVFEVPGLNKLIRKAEPEAIEAAGRTLAQRLRARGSNMTKTGVAEGLQEFGAAIAQNAIERGYNPEQDLVNYEAAEEGGIGGVAGAIFQGVVDTVAPGRPRGASQPETPETPEQSPAERTSQNIESVNTAQLPQQERDEMEAMLSEFNDEPQAQPAPQNTDDARQAEADAGILALQRQSDFGAPNEFPEQELDTARVDLFSSGIDPRTSTPDDVTAQAELNREQQQRESLLQGPQQSNVPQDDPAMAELLAEIEAQESERQQEELRQNELYNQAQGNNDPGAQPDMFQRELIQREGKDDLFAMRERQEAERQAERNLETRAQEDMQLAEMIGQEQGIKQQELDLRQPTVTQGVNPRKERRRQVRKELAQGQAQRQRVKDREGKSVAALRERQAQQPPVPPQPVAPKGDRTTPIDRVAERTSVQGGPPLRPTTMPPSANPQFEGGPEVAQVVEAGRNQALPQAQMPQTNAPQTPVAQGVSKAMRAMNRANAQAKASKEARAERRKTKTTGKTQAKPAAKKNTVKPVKTKGKSNAQSKPQSGTPKTQTKTKQPAKTAKPKADTPKANEKPEAVVGKKQPAPKPAQNKTVAPVEPVNRGEADVADAVTKVQSAKKGRELNTDADAKALNSFVKNAGGDIDLALKSIAFDILADEPARKGGGKVAAEKALNALKADERGKGAVLAVEKYMADKTMNKLAELNKSNAGKDDRTILEGIKSRELELQVQQALLSDLQFEAEMLKGKKLADFRNLEIKPVEDNIAEIKKSIAQSRKELKEQLLPVDELLDTTKIVPLNVADLLRNGDLRGALRALSDVVETQRVKSLLRKLSDNTGITKVELVENLTSESGIAAAGSYNPATNTIKLDTELGMDVHTIIHEMMHAVTSAQLSKKSHPTTKKLQKLYDDVKDRIGNAYASKNLDEFVAEAFSNGEFQRELSKLKPDGTPVTAWERFSNAIANFVRNLFNMDSKDVYSAMSEVDNLVQSIIQPAPSVRMAGELLSTSTPDFVAERGSKIGQNIAASQRSKAEREGWANSVKSFFNGKNLRESASNVPRVLFTKLLQLQGLADLSKVYGFGNIGNRLNEVLRMQYGKTEQMNEEIQNDVASISKNYDKLNDTQSQMLNTLIYDTEFGATVAQVDPSVAPNSEQAKQYKTDPDKREDYLKLKSIWDDPSFGPDARKVYNETKAFYEKQHKQLLAVMNQRIDESITGNSQETAKTRKGLYDQLVENSKLDVYFPLVREGDFTLEYKMKGDNDLPQRVVEQFETPNDVELRKAELKQLGNAITEIKDGRRSSQVRLDEVPPTSFVRKWLEQMQTAGVDDGTIQQMLDLFIDTLPESSFAKAFKSRKNVPGYITDTREALRIKSYQTGAQIVRFEYAQRLASLKSQIESFEPEQGNKNLSPMQVQIRDELAERVRFALEGAKFKGFEEVVKNLNQMSFVYTIGFNVASAIVNLSQVPMVIFPMLGAKYGFRNTQKEIAKASKLVFNSSMGDRSESGFGKLSAKASIAGGLDNYFDITSRLKERTLDDGSKVQDMDYTVKLRPDIKKTLRDTFPEKTANEMLEQLERAKDFILEAKLQGQLTKSFLIEALGLEDGTKKTRGGVAGVLDKVTGFSAGMFSQAERYNRQVSLLSTYNLEFDNLYNAYREDGMSDAEARGKAKTEATDYALYKTTEMNGGSTLETASGLSQENIGRIAMMYKNYGIQMYTMMWKAAFKWTDKNLPADKRKVARNQLIGLHGSALFFSGVYGLPIYGAVSMAYNLLAGEEDDDFETIVQDFVGEGAFRGGVNNLLELGGLDIDPGSRMRMTDLLLQESRFNPDPSPEEQLGTIFGGVALSIGKRIARGVGDMQEGNYQRGVEQLMPTVITNMIRPFRYVDEGGIRTRRYDVITDDITNGQMAAQILGFAPENYIRQQESNRRFKNIDRAINETASRLTKQYYVAIRRGDIDGIVETMEKIDKFNKENPDFALDRESINRSLKGHMRTTERMYNGISLSKKMLDVIAQVGEDAELTVMFPRGR